MTSFIALAILGVSFNVLFGEDTVRMLGKMLFIVQVSRVALLSSTSEH